MLPLSQSFGVWTCPLEITPAVHVEWFSLSLRENELGLEPLLVVLISRFVFLSIPRQGARYPFT